MATSANCEKHGLSAQEIEWVIERGLIEFDRNPLWRRAAVQGDRADSGG